MQVAPDVNQSPSLLTLYAYVYLSRAALSHLVIDDIHVGVTDRKKRSWELGSEVERCALCVARTMLNKRVSLALASMARDDPPRSISERCIYYISRKKVDNKINSYSKL